MSDDEAGDATVSAAAISVGVHVHAPRVGVRSYLSSGILRSAKPFTEMAQSIENVNLGSWGPPLCSEHQDLVTSAVLNAVRKRESRW